MLQAQHQMSSYPYASTRHVGDLEQCWFYHVMDLPGYGTVGTDWDLRDQVDEYLGNVDLRGKRALDVGTASGFLTFAMEKRGAEVVSFDADVPQRSFVLPYRQHIFNIDRSRWADQYGAQLEKLKNSYWLAHRVLDSKARAYYGDALEISDDIGVFDVVVVGQILVHISDPVRALCSAMRRCSDCIVITEGMLDRDEPIAGLCARADVVNPSSWWHLSTGLYREIFAMAGFAIERVSKASYRCIAGGVERPIELTTIIARRQGLTMS